MINEEIDNVKYDIDNFLINEEITDKDERKIRELIRTEVSVYIL